MIKDFPSIEFSRQRSRNLSSSLFIISSIVLRKRMMANDQKVSTPNIKSKGIYVSGLGKLWRRFHPKLSMRSARSPAINTGFSVSLFLLFYSFLLKRDRMVQLWEIETARRSKAIVCHPLTPFVEASCLFPFFLFFLIPLKTNKLTR